MAPKRANRSDQNNSVSTTDISNIRTTEQERQWDGQPYQKVSWYMLNLRALFQEIPEARQYIESGVLVGSKTVTVYSLAHVQTYVNGDYERGTLKAPFDFSTLPNECTPISTPVAAAESPEDADSAQPSRQRTTYSQGPKQHTRSTQRSSKTPSRAAASQRRRCTHDSTTYRRVRSRHAIHHRKSS